MLSDWTKLFFSVLYKFVILRVFEEQIEVCTNYYGQYNEVVEGNSPNKRRSFDYIFYLYFKCNNTSILCWASIMHAATIQKIETRNKSKI